MRLLIQGLSKYHTYLFKLDAMQDVRGSEEYA